MTLIQSLARTMMFPDTIKDTNSTFILPEQTCQRFTLADIHSATNNFDEAVVIGRGGFGKVYKCHSERLSLKEVAVKRLHSMSNQGASEFEAEVELLSRLWHANLVSLIGYCNEENEIVLVYEFMPNGTLEDHLHKADTELSWLQRLKICIGVARGLDYLHEGTSTQHGIIHRDVKSSNILLDKNFAAKISDFGLAKVSPINQTITFVKTRVKGTFGYMDPCYFYSGKLTRKSDVYAFGVVMFEVLSGRQAVDPTIDEEQWSLAAWAQDKVKEGKLNQIISSRLIGQISKKGLKEFASIASQCLGNQPKQRPSMAEVVVKLESILTRERENTGFGVDEGRFLNKVRYFFTGKTETIQARAVETKKQSLRIFTYAELVTATQEFKDEMYSTNLGEYIYKGWVDKRTYAPTKEGVGLAMYVRKRHIGMSKLELKLHHLNLVMFLGYCIHVGEYFSVHELIQDPSLDKLLYGEPHRPSLSWAARLNIALGAARGLSFLHQRNHPAYSQFKTAHILVDSDYNPRLWNFEVEPPFVALSSYSFNEDAFYAAPEWFNYHLAELEGYSTKGSYYEADFGVKSEIYAFGVVLLEILTGIKVFDRNRPEGKQNLVKWATPLLADEVNMRMIMDPQLQKNCLPIGAFELAQLISKCLQASEEKRPSMEEIFNVLYECNREQKIHQVLNENT